MRVLLFVAAVFALAACSPNNVTNDASLKQYFDEQKSEGCFALFNNGNGQFTVYNLARYRDSAYTPGATFDIVNALVGLQTGKIVNDSMVITWDGQVRSNAAWNKDLTMTEAFRTSALPYFQEVARRVGKDTLQRWLDSLAYGSKQIRSAVDSFWFNNTLTLTPDEQLGIVKRLYFNQLPFFTNYQQMVKNAMVVEDKPTHVLQYKTGQAPGASGKTVAWVAGWVEENRHPYFFVLTMERSEAANLEKASLATLRKILTQLNFFRGER